jgi:hypothetical protein
MAYEYLAKPVREKKPRRGLQRKGWYRHSQGLGAISSNELKSQRAQLERERKAEKKAKIEGAEYHRWLQLQFSKVGCPFQVVCRNHGYGRCHIHHVKEGSGAGMGQRGLAEDQIFTCAKCHLKGDSPGNSFRAMEEEAGVNLRELANLYASHAFALGLLPTEQCEECREFHSQKYMLDRPMPDGKVQRICAAKCGGVGLKESGDESVLW